ncbi:MAG: metal ABC transporter solute-binding protein, Zn/Mn family [Chthoniobacterales bacterium]
MHFKNSFFFLTIFLTSLGLHAKPLQIVAAENFYGSVAQQVSGSSVNVVSIMSNPNQDPHEFQADAKTAKAVADADIIIYNGLGYDTWMEKLLSADKTSNRIIINVAQLVGAKKGANPHLWYDPKTMPALATKLALVLKKPEGEVAFSASMKPLLEKIATLKIKTVGMKVTATEPVFGYMASALGFRMLNEGYQWAIMNDATPSFQETVNFEKSLISNTAKLLFQNSQTMNPSTQKMIAIAQEHHIPVIGITETQPANAKTYVAWMLSQLKEIETSLRVD